MKIIFILFLLFSCSNPDKEEQRNKKFALLALLYSQRPMPITDCRSWSGEQNQLYYSEQYSLKFANDYTQYKTIIIGDSTMDISTRFAGYLSGTSQSVAVSGNTLCDMREQLGVINTKNPEFILISSAGGNDLAKKTPPDKTIKSGELLLDSIKAKFPSAKITFVGVHPTFLDYANRNRGDTNKSIESMTAQREGCYINPDSAFTIDASGYPSQSEMLDSIHYNQTTAFKIRSKIISCGVPL
jgi:hypothetical protein